jgi:hypothetical protein
MPGVDVYKRDEIPEEYHYKNNKLTHEILVVAKPNYYIRGIPERYTRDRGLWKQIPQADPSLSYAGGTYILIFLLPPNPNSCFN